MVARRCDRAGGRVRVHHAGAERGRLPFGPVQAAGGAVRGGRVDEAAVVAAEAAAHAGEALARRGGFAPWGAGALLSTVSSHVGAFQALESG